MNEMYKVKVAPTFTATIYVGFREGYSDEVRALDMAYETLLDLANSGGFCVTVTHTRFIYRDNFEPGIAVGLINYPRFPENFNVLHDRALLIAKTLMKTFHQLRVSVVFPDETVTLEAE